MFFWTEKERLTLGLLGLSALLAVGLIVWQQRKSPIDIKKNIAPNFEKWDAMLSEARQVNINAATSQELQKLPGIGPSLAGQIVDYRDSHGPFETRQDLERVPGIGPKTMEDLKEYITVE